MEPTVLAVARVLSALTVLVQVPVVFTGTLMAPAQSSLLGPVAPCPMHSANVLLIPVGGVLELGYTRMK